MAKRIIKAHRAPAGPPTFDEWIAKHSERGAGPQRHTKVHVYEYWACTCGSRATLADDGVFRERAA